MRKKRNWGNGDDTQCLTSREVDKPTTNAHDIIIIMVMEARVWTLISCEHIDGTAYKRWGAG